MLAVSSDDLPREQIIKLFEKHLHSQSKALGSHLQPRIYCFIPDNSVVLQHAFNQSHAKEDINMRSPTYAAYAFCRSDHLRRDWGNATVGSWGRGIFGMPCGVNEGDGDSQGA
ncbi:unnamed protein product [Symbiodinium natans]|uniref:Uncharacterized protein n=1 Tax=Symbiodinium natans TaxID=878477 RepID=A0A812N8C2_9DINO|nr:unnamed protein product [Symbiodinium natans]